MQPDLSGVRRGDAAAEQLLWQRYFKRLAEVADGRLPAHNKRAFDGEDVALSALRCFLGAAREGRYPDLDDPHDLWSLLVAITARKAGSYVRRLRAQKRGGGTSLGESGFSPPGSDIAEDGSGIDRVPGREPTPEFAAQVAEEFSTLLERLDAPDLRQIATLKMEGFTVEEIAEKVGSTRRTVERRLAMIRSLLTESAPDGGE